MTASFDAQLERLWFREEGNKQGRNSYWTVEGGHGHPVSPRMVARLGSRLARLELPARWQSWSSSLGRWLQS